IRCSGQNSACEQTERRGKEVAELHVGGRSAIGSGGRRAFEGCPSEVELEGRAAPVELAMQAAYAVRFVVHHLGFDGAGRIGGGQGGERDYPVATLSTAEVY